MDPNRKDPVRKFAEDVAREVTQSRDKRGAYRDEDDMIEDYREIREETYWDEMDRRYGDGY